MAEYEKLHWRNNESPAISAENLNHMDEGIAALYDLLNTLHPVGEYYETSNADFNPNGTWPGTWELENDGRVHISTSTLHAAGTTGGEERVTLTAGQSGMPSHGHTFTQPKLPNHVHTATHKHSFTHLTKDGAEGTSKWTVHSEGSATNWGINNYTGNTGNPTTLPACTGGAVGSASAINAAESHENMMPYRTVYRWHRVA